MMVVVREQLAVGGAEATDSCFCLLVRVNDEKISCRKESKILPGRALCLRTRLLNAHACRNSWEILTSEACSCTAAPQATWIHPLPMAYVDAVGTQER